MDKLLQDRVNEAVHRQIRTMAKAQGQSGNSKAVEEAEKNIPKSAKAKQNVQM